MLHTLFILFYHWNFFSAGHSVQSRQMLQLCNPKLPLFNSNRKSLHKLSCSIVFFLPETIVACGNCQSWTEIVLGKGSKKWKKWPIFENFWKEVYFPPWKSQKHEKKWFLGKQMSTVLHETLIRPCIMLATTVKDQWGALRAPPILIL